ncbi:MAG: hypothetical protein DI566_13450 [Microbacterium sp.]|nr:MAG: hypothetical protein DI566_13450 [Microbacterium sp.]
MSDRVIFVGVAAVFVACLGVKLGLLGLAAGLCLVVGYEVARSALPPAVVRVTNLLAVAVTFGMALWLAIGEADAAEAATDPAPATSVAQALQPIVDMVVLALVGAFIAWLKIKLSAWFGVELDAKHRETLQSALTTAAGIVLADGSKSIGAGLGHLRMGAGDAIRHFGLDDALLERLLTAKVAASAPTKVVINNETSGSLKVRGQ